MGGTIDLRSRCSYVIDRCEEVALRAPQRHDTPQEFNDLHSRIIGTRSKPMHEKI